MSVLDPEVVASLLELDDGEGEMLDEIVGLFAEDGPGRLDAIAEAVRTGDGPGLRFAAHALKSSALNLGAQALARLCSDLEQTGAADRAAGREAEVEALRGLYAEALAALRAAGRGGRGV